MLRAAAVHPMFRPAGEQTDLCDWGPAKWAKGTRSAKGRLFPQAPHLNTKTLSPKPFLGLWSAAANPKIANTVESTKVQVLTASPKTAKNTYTRYPPHPYPISLPISLLSGAPCVFRASEHSYIYYNLNARRVRRKTSKNTPKKY